MVTELHWTVSSLNKSIIPVRLSAVAKEPYTEADLEICKGRGRGAGCD